MNKSITYYITLWVLKLKGVKKAFSKSPIDYKKLRKQDVTLPSASFLKNKEVNSFSVLKTLITEVKSNNTSKKLLIYIHGGAFVSGPAKHHWDSLREISKQTQQTIWMCNYPKAPEHKISEISKNIDAVYQHALKHFDGKHITLMGDSVGGTLATALTQRLIQKSKTLPNKIVLISPVMDATMSNKEIAIIHKRDPMLSKKGVLSAKMMCAENNDLKSSLISPIHGNFKQFPTTILFLAENDITYPDQLLAVQKMKASLVNLEVVIGNDMPHIWPLLPVMKEAKVALNQIINRL